MALAMGESSRARGASALHQVKNLSTTGHDSRPRRAARSRGGRSPAARSMTPATSVADVPSATSNARSMSDDGNRLTGR